MTNYNEDFYSSGFMMDELWDNNLQPTLVPPLNSSPPPAPNTHLDYLFNLINQSNQTQLQAVDFTVGIPTIYTGTESGVNTTISLIPLPLTGYIGSIVFNYPRLDISSIFESQIGSINLQNAYKLSDIINQLNTIYGTDLQPTDYIDTTLPVQNPTYPNLPLVVTIATTPTSIKYTGTYDYVLNYTQVVLSQPVDARRLVVVYSGLTPQESLYKYNLDGSVDNSFVFLQNVSDIQSFSITESYYRNDQTIYLSGSFVFTSNIGGIVSSGSYVGILIDQTGSVIQTYTVPLYNFPATSLQYTNRNIGYIYSIYPSNTIPMSIVRCDNFGVTDTSFNNRLPYVPSMLRISDSGNIYAVSSWFSGADPFNSGINTELLRIDRLIPSGSLDTSFIPVYMRLSNTSSPVSNFNVVDIKENQNGDIAVLVNSELGYGIGTPTLVVNGMGLNTVDSNGNSLSTWLPVISLLSNGMLSTPLPNSLNVFSSTAISDVPTAIDTDSNIMLYCGNDFVFLTHKNNPFTQIPGYQLNNFSSDGTYNPYNPNTYINFPVYSEYSKMDGYSDGTTILSGVLGSVNIGGINTASKTALSIIDPNNNCFILNNPLTGSLPTGTVSISNFFCF